MKKQLLIIASLAGILTMGSVQALTYAEFQAMDREDRRAYAQSLTDDERTAQRESFQAEGATRPSYSGRGGYQSNYESGQSRSNNGYGGYGGGRHR
jgi:hypothetical protein